MPRTNASARPESADGNRSPRRLPPGYDSTRHYYLLGRDQMLRQIADRPAGSVLEMGCGTARNLRVLADQAPHHTLYGVDASLAMLASAREKLECADCTHRVRLAHSRFQDFDPVKAFGGEGPFDVIFFSYVLSMIPEWSHALDLALTHLSPEGALYIVDFWEPDELPSAGGANLRRWLNLSDGEPRPDILHTLRSLDAKGRLSCTITPVARRYAYVAAISPRTSDLAVPESRTAVPPKVAAS